MPPPPIEERQVRPLQRLRHAVELGDLVVLAVERERAGGEQTLEDRDRLGEPGDAHAGRSSGIPAFS